MSDWQVTFACCWCGCEFIQRTVAKVEAWTCPTRRCFERQMVWKMLDKDGRLFYLPLPRQVEVEEAIQSQLYGAIAVGGHRNSGKSAMLRRVCYRLCGEFEDFSVLFLRRSMPELLLNHQKYAIKESRRLGFRYGTKQIDFPETGSELVWGSCWAPDSYKAFIGGDVDLIVFEQLEEFESTQFVEISASTGRTRKRKGWRGLVLAGENPGGPLSAFIDEFFITKSPDPELYPDYNPKNYFFIHAALEDNPYADPRYVDNLATLAPARRAMFRFGRRDIFPLQYFKNFLRPDRVQALTIPKEVERLTAMHWGFFKAGMFLWAVVLPDGRIYIEREYPFIETVAADVANTIVQLNVLHGIKTAYAWGNPPGRVAEDDIGEGTFETLYRHGLPVVESVHDPVNGWQRLQHWFEPMRTEDGSEQAALIVSPTCTTLIRTLPQLLQDENHAEEVDERGATEAAKALRYLVMARPEPPWIPPPAEGRDLSKLPPRVREEIEYMRRADADEGESHAAAYSMGEFWGTDDHSHR